MKISRRLAIGGALAIPALRTARAAGNVLRIAIGNSLSSLDPMRATIGDEYIFAVLAFNGLTRIRPDLGVEPDLAESWSYSDDLKHWTFKLRRGVKFHNGREMVAEDVLASFRRLLDPANGAGSRTNYTMIESMSAPDPYTAVFNLQYAYGGFADILADRQIKIVPRDATADLATKPVGTGAFMFKSYTPGDRVVLVRNPDYFEPGKPKLDGIELRIIPEMSVSLSALKAGDVDVVWDLPLDQVKDLSKSPGIRADSVATASWDGAIMNNETGPFKDVRVRRAFHMAVDKRDVVELTLFGQGVPTISPIPPTHPFYASDIPITAADPAGARKLLAEAGFPDGVKVPIIVPAGRAVRERLGVTLQQLAAPGGFDLQVQRVPLSSYTAEVSGKAPLYIDGYFARPTVDTSTYPFLHSKGSWNPILWHYNNPTVDRELDAARTTGDTAQQKTHYVAMQHALNDDPAGFFAYAVNYACAYRSEVKNLATHPMRWFDCRDTTLA